jgi:DNA/RNA endonuclease G (NUC1)
MRLTLMIGIFALSISLNAVASDKQTLGNIWGAIKDVAKEKIDVAKEKIDSRLKPANARTLPQPSDNKPGSSQFIDYGFYSVDYNCYHRGFNYIRYESVPDQGSLERYEPFHKEPALRTDCPSQKTTASYKKRYGQEQYHRGHGTHQNIWDHNLKWMMLTNRMTNVVPQNGVLNASGLWRKLEKRVECARDETTVTVYLGNDWGMDKSNDHFVRSHGVTTPDYLWRVHVYASHPNQAYVWHMPNDATPSSNSYAAHRVSLADLQNVTKDDFIWPMPMTWLDAKGRDPYQNTTCSWK